MNIKKTLMTVGASTAIFANIAMPALAANTTTVVTSNDMANDITDVIADPTKWFFYNDETDFLDDSLGAFVTGPATTPEGEGSVEISVTGSQRRNLATYQFSGTLLSDITELKFSTYNPSFGNSGSVNRSGYLNFNVDFDGSDTWQRRLAYVPSENGAVAQDTWQEWDAIDSGDALWWWSGYASNGNKWPDSDTNEYRTWSDLVSSFPDIGIRTTDSWLGIRVGEPYASGYTENIDAFVFGTASGVKTFDFEPALTPGSKDECKKGGWSSFNSPSFTNQGQCVSYVQANEKAGKKN